MSLICKEDLLNVYLNIKKERFLMGSQKANSVSLNGVIKTISEFPEVLEVKDNKNTNEEK